MTPYETDIEHHEPDATPPPISFQRAERAEYHCQEANVEISEHAVSESKSRTNSQKSEKQICEVAIPGKLNAWEVINQAMTDHCRQCWPYREDCGAGEDCTLYPVRTDKLRERLSADELARMIHGECVRCLGTSDTTICTSPRCALHRFRHGTRARIEKMLI